MVDFLLDLSGLLQNVFGGVLFALFRALYLEYMLHAHSCFEPRRLIEFVGSDHHDCAYCSSRYSKRDVNTELEIFLCLYQS